jgi:hypothetical protein
MRTYLVALAVLLIASCGVPTDDEPTALPPLETTTVVPSIEPPEAFIVETTAPPTTPAPRPPTTRASRARPGGGGAVPPAAVQPAPAGGGVVVSSTAYCLTGHMANGRPARRGAVAANRWPLGTRLRVSPSPVGEIVTVEDRIGHGSQLDFALPGDCGAARAWGRRAVTVEVLS